MSVPSRHQTVVLVAILAAATLVAFWPAVGCGFINYDDPTYVTENSHVRGGLAGAGILWAWTATYAANWHPLTWISHMADWQMYGSSPGGPHRTSLLLHIANTLLLFLVLARMTGAARRSAFAAALFGVHPLHVQSVVWIAERKDVLSTLFMMLALWAYAGYAESPTTRRFVAVAVAMAAGLCAKPMLVTLPFVLLLLDAWPLGRFTAGLRGAERRAVAQRLVREKLPLLPLAAASSAITIVAQARGRSLVSFARIPWSERVANSAVSCVTYLSQTVWPARLAVFYPHPREALPVWEVAAAALVLAGVTALGVRERRRRPYLLVGWLWYLGTLVPVLGLVQVGEQARADRYTYVPLIGIFIVVAWGLPDLVTWALAGSRRNREPLDVDADAGWLLPAGATVLALVAVTRVEAAYWHDSVSLFTRAIEVTGPNAPAHNNLGVALAESGRVDDAISQYREALRIDPRHVAAYGNLGLVLERRGRADEAVRLLEEALRIDPGSAPLHDALGLALAALGKPDQAIAEHEAALRIFPESSDAHNNLAIALLAVGRTEEGIREYEEALRLRPDVAETHNNLGLALLEQGRVDEALGQLAEAVRIRPDYARGHVNFAAALLVRERYAEAWNEVRLARRYGADPPQELVRRLTEKMPER